MIFGHGEFYHESIRKYVTAFGNLFNDIVVQRNNANSTRIQTIQVPIAYAPKENFLARLTADPTLEKPIAIQLPAMSFEMTGMTYDATRRLTGKTKNLAYRSSDVNKLYSQYTPVPWNMDFNLYIYGKNMDDVLQILEQIVPFFGPEWTNTIHLIPQLGLNFDCPTIINGMSIEDTYENNFVDRRVIIYTIKFTMKGFFFGPIKTTGIIKRVQVDLSVVQSPSQDSNTVINHVATAPITNEEIAYTGRSSRIVVVPGLLANGSPTTNSAASIPYSQISANTNWDYASNTFFYSDGKKYDPRTGEDNPLPDQTNPTRTI